MNVLLIDNSPILQKTLQYFLHPYAPSFYSANSQEDWPQKIDIVFLDSIHKDNKHVSHLKDKEVPIVLISRDEQTLKELADNYSAVLKKPVQHTKLQDIIHHLIPETRSLKASPHLKFYESHFEQEDQNIALNKDESAQIEEKSAPAIEEFEENIPLEPNEGLKNETDEKPELKSNPSEEAVEKPPAFNHTQAIAIPDDIKLVDEMDSTSLHHTNTFLKKVSESIKNQPDSSEEKTKEFSVVDQNFNPLQKAPEETLEDNQTSLIKSSTKTPSEISPNKDTDISKSEVSAEHSLPDTPITEKPTPSKTADPKLEALSDKITEIINKQFTAQWESFIHTQLKKDLKNMVHEEVNQIFKEQMKDILTTEGIQSIKKASEEISWKVIPELSKQIIQKEIKKLLDKPSSK